MLKITIPKGFFENKSSVSLQEFVEMFNELISIIQKLEEDLSYELETDSRFMQENVKLRQRVKELEDEFKRLGLDGAI